MKNKGNLRQLRYNIWLYFIIFTLALIAIIWILQFLFLESYYQKVRYKRLVDSGTLLTDTLEGKNASQKDYDECVKELIKINELGIFSYVASYDGSFLKVESPYSYFLSTSSGVNIDSNIEDLLKRAITKINAENKETLCDYFENGLRADMPYCVFVSKIKLEDERNVYLMLLSSRESLSESISVMQYQLIIVTVVVICISFILSWSISIKLSDPIRRMSITAKRWAEGDNSVIFRGNSYDELNELAEALNYAKEGISQTGFLQRDLLANVSHDLKTPLTMIKAYAEMIRDLSGDIKEKRNAHTQVIIDEADRLTLLVNDILDLSKLQNNTDNLQMDRVNLSELIKMVIYRFQTFMENEGYTIEQYIENDLYTICDEKKIEQVVYNLIGNSINYTGDDKNVKIYLHKNTNDNKIVLEIIDSGKGINSDRIQTIWEKYFRFSETHQRPIKGTGLGLSIVKTILLNHKLKFGVISKKGLGSNFFIQFNYAENTNNKEKV